MTRKASAYDKQLKAAATELGLPKDHWQVEKLATLQLMFIVARNKWSSGTVSNSSDMLALMNEITLLRKEAKLMEPMDINVHIVERYTGIADITCPHCQKTSRHEVSNRPFDAPEPHPTTPTAESRTTNDDNAIAEPSTDDPAPQPAKVVPLTTRPGISPSAFHDQRFASGEQPPLKRLQRGSYEATPTYSPAPDWGAAHPLPPIPRE